MDSAVAVPPRRERLWGASPDKDCRFGPEPVSGSAFRAAVSNGNAQNNNDGLGGSSHCTANQRPYCGADATEFRDESCILKVNTLRLVNDRFS